MLHPRARLRYRGDAPSDASADVNADANDAAARAQNSHGEERLVAIKTILAGLTADDSLRSACARAYGASRSDRSFHAAYHASFHGSRSHSPLMEWQMSKYVKHALVVIGLATACVLSASPAVALGACDSRPITKAETITKVVNVDRVACGLSEASAPPPRPAYTPAQSTTRDALVAILSRTAWSAEAAGKWTELARSLDASSDVRAVLLDILAAAQRKADLRAGAAKEAAIKARAALAEARAKRAGVDEAEASKQVAATEQEESSSSQAAKVRKKAAMDNTQKFLDILRSMTIKI